MNWMRELICKYLLNRDVAERQEEVLQTLAEGKEKEARALRRVARATGYAEARRWAQDAEEDARWLREQLADQVGVEVISGQQR